MSSYEFFAVALIACIAGFAAQPNALVAQSAQPYTRYSEDCPGGCNRDQSLPSESLEIIPNMNSAMHRNYRRQTDDQTRPHQLSLPQRERGTQDINSMQAYDDARRPVYRQFDRPPYWQSYRQSYRQPARAAYQSQRNSEQTPGSQGYGDRQYNKLNRVQLGEAIAPDLNRPRHPTHQRNGHHGCHGSSCDRHNRHRNDGGQSLDKRVAPYAEPPHVEPPHVERGALNQNEADLPPQLGIYRPSQTIRLPH